MNPRIQLATVSLLLGAFAVSPIAANEEALKKDLTAVIALQGLPCGQVVTVTTQAENDYAVTCKDANKYRVYLNSAGKVVVEKRK